MLILLIAVVPALIVFSLVGKASSDRRVVQIGAAGTVVALLGGIAFLPLDLFFMGSAIGLGYRKYRQRQPIRTVPIEVAPCVVRPPDAQPSTADGIVLSVLIVGGLVVGLVLAGGHASAPAASAPIAPSSPEPFTQGPPTLSTAPAAAPPPAVAASAPASTSHHRPVRIRHHPATTAHRRGVAGPGCVYRTAMTDDDYRACGVSPPGME